METGRPVSRALRGMVATPHALATQTGLRILRQGGNAVEAAVALAVREVRTPDIGGEASTEDVTAAVHRHLSWLRWGGAPAEESAASTEWAV